MLIQDSVLVEQSIAGDREAFSEIIHRYQSLVCSIAYGVTGRLEISEELAQEAFLTAWQSLPSLKDAAKLRPWLCSVIRNLANDRARRDRRDVLHHAVSFAPEESVLQDRTVSDPAAESIVREEAELLDRTLASLPEIYREPLVLYHREDQSIARVAELLDLNPNTVKQRLARGREMLRAEIAELVERGLQRSAPGRTFTIAVLAALPAMTTSAQAATLTATAVPGAALAKASAWTGIAGAVAGPLLGLLGGWFGYKLSLQSARSEREREHIRRTTRKLVVSNFAFAMLFGAMLAFAAVWAKSHPLIYAMLIVGGIGIYLVTLATFSVSTIRIASRIRREEGTDQHLTPEQFAKRLPSWMSTTAYPRHFESSWRLLGLPLICIRFRGATPKNFLVTPPALGWIAIGDVAIGVLYASGGIAVGGVAFGGLSAGLISVGGLGIGILSLAGCAIGYWANGGVAVGLIAFGGVSLAWQVASGGVAVAKYVAVGGVALAEQANNEAAKAIVNQHPFLVASMHYSSSVLWLAIVGLGLLPTVFALLFIHPQRDEATHCDH